LTLAKAFLSVALSSELHAAQLRKARAPAGFGWQPDTSLMDQEPTALLGVTFHLPSLLNGRRTLLCC
jgi:hypothetical protein